jgi:hypothetical protein
MDPRIRKQPILHLTVREDLGLSQVPWEFRVQIASCYSFNDAASNVSAISGEG